MVNQTDQHGDTVAHGSAVRSRESSPALVAPPSSLKPTSESTSDNEASEGPVREKLKKTSIASIPRQTGPSEGGRANEAETTPTIAHVLANDAQATEEGSSPDTADRGRPTRKRSFDDLDMESPSQPNNPQPDAGNQSGRERKRSKDVRMGKCGQPIAYESSVSTDQSPDVLEKENNTNKASQSTAADTSLEQMNNDSSPGPADIKVTYEEMHHSAFSPRKKRSRDQMDADAQREQKIPATEEAKAHRRSEEHERDERSRVDDGLALGGNSTQPVGGSAAESTSEVPTEVTLIPLSTNFQVCSLHPRAWLKVALPIHQ